MGRLEVLSVLLQLKSIGRKPGIGSIDEIHIGDNSNISIEGRDPIVLSCINIWGFFGVIGGNNYVLGNRRILMGQGRRPDANRRSHFGAHLFICTNVSIHVLIAKSTKFNPSLDNPVKLLILLVTTFFVFLKLVLTFPQWFDAPSNCEALFRLSTRGFIIHTLLSTTLCFPLHSVYPLFALDVPFPAFSSKTPATCCRTLQTKFQFNRIFLSLYKVKIRFVYSFSLFCATKS